MRFGFVMHQAIRSRSITEKALTTIVIFISGCFPCVCQGGGGATVTPSICRFSVLFQLTHSFHSREVNGRGEDEAAKVC